MFKGKKEKVIIDNYRKHIDKAIEAIELLSTLIKKIVEGNEEESLSIHLKICEIESEADSIRRENEYLLAQGIFFPSERTFFISLSEKIDMVIDKTKQASRRLVIRKIEPAGIEFLKNSMIMEYVSTTEMAVKKLYEAARKLFDEPMKALEIAHEVEIYEEKADSIKLELLRNLYSRENSMNPLTVVQLDQVIRRIDDISDYAEEASDVIVLIVAGMKP